MFSITDDSPPADSYHPASCINRQICEFETQPTLCHSQTPVTLFCLCGDSWANAGCSAVASLDHGCQTGPSPSACWLTALGTTLLLLVSILVNIHYCENKKLTTDKLPWQWTHDDKWFALPVPSQWGLPWTWISYQPSPRSASSSSSALGFITGYNRRRHLVFRSVRPWIVVIICVIAF